MRVQMRVRLAPCKSFLLSFSLSRVMPRLDVDWMLMCVCGFRNYVDSETGEVNTGHHDILVDNQYKEIGCAFTRDPSPDEGFWTGLWICNLKL